jgi:SAM-dependent methyltransferase
MEDLITEYQNDTRTLILGCGSDREKRIALSGQSKEWEGAVVRLDHNDSYEPDVVWDLNQHPLPFDDREFDEIHAYEVLEHLGSMGDAEFFFNEWNEYYRILKPNGLFFAIVPRIDSPWAWADPSHRRIIVPETLVFLQQKAYEENVGHGPMSDFRNIYFGDFAILQTDFTEDQFIFVLRKLGKTDGL